MSYELKYADLLYDLLKQNVTVHVYTGYSDEVHDIVNKKFVTIESDPFVVGFKPELKEIKTLYKELKKEIRVNRYKFANLVLYLKNIHNGFKSLIENDILITKDNVYDFGKGITVYFDSHEGNSDPVSEIDKLPHEALAKIQEYFNSQREIVDGILSYIHSLIPDESLLDSLDEPVKDESDPRIYIPFHSSVIKRYFSFLNKETKDGQPILSRSDYDYFLHKNFQGFPNVTKKRKVSFNLISASHMQFCIYMFYSKYSNKKEYNRIRWAELLKNTFPSKFTGELKVIASNFKKNDSAIHRFKELGLDLPE